MKTSLIIAIGALALTASPSLTMADPEHKHEATHDAKAMKAIDAPTMVLQAYSQAITSKNVEEMAKHVASDGEDFTIFEGGGVNIGWADYRDHHLAPEFANPDLTFHTYDYQNIETYREGDLAFSTFSIDMIYTYKGEDKSKTGRGTAILKRHGDTWKIVHLHTS